jgi:hypothetical protein
MDSLRKPANYDKLNHMEMYRGHRATEENGIKTLNGGMQWLYGDSSCSVTIEKCGRYSRYHMVKGFTWSYYLHVSSIKLQIR